MLREFVNKMSVEMLVVCPALLTVLASVVGLGTGSYPLHGMGQHVPPQATPTSNAGRFLDRQSHAHAFRLVKDGTPTRPRLTLAWIATMWVV